MRRRLIEQNRTRNHLLRIQYYPQALINCASNKLKNIDPFILLFKFTARTKYLADLAMISGFAILPLTLIVMLVFDVYGARRPSFPKLELIAKSIINRDRVQAGELMALFMLPPFLIMSVMLYFIHICSLIFINRHTESDIPALLLFGDIYGLITQHPESVRNNAVIHVPGLLWQPPRDYSLQYLASLSLRQRMMSLFVPHVAHKNLFHAIDNINLPLDIKYQILSFLDENDIKNDQLILNRFESFRFQDSKHNYRENQAIADFIESKYKTGTQHNLLTLLYAMHARGKDNRQPDIESGNHNQKYAFRRLHYA